MDSLVLIKIISAFSYPLGLAFLLLLLRWLASWLGKRNAATVMGLLAISLLATASNPLAARWLAATLEQQYPQQPLQDIARHDAILVLGGGLRLPQAPAQHTQIGAASDRYLYAVRLYRAGKADRIVLSGGNVYPQTGFQGEAYYASELMQQWGVPQAAIAIETGSRTTAENQAYTADFLRSQNIHTVLLVTSALHMPRAYNLFKSLPVSFTPASADVLVRQHSAPEVFNWIPSAAALQLSTVAIHEYYGRWFDGLKARIEKGR